MDVRENPDRMRPYSLVTPSMTSSISCLEWTSIFW